MAAAKTTMSAQETTADRESGGWQAHQSKRADGRGASARSQQAAADLVESAIEAFAGATPAAFIDESQTAAAAARLAQALVLQPPRLARRSARLSAELTKVALGTSDVAPAASDKRFADKAWSENPFFKRLEQTYLAWNTSLYGLIDELDLDEKSRLRSRFVAGLFTEAFAPTNYLLTNPAALREAARTKGRSLLDGARHLVHDVRTGQSLPSMVDTRPFEVGKNLAATPGAVVFRNEVLELVQYQPMNPSVHALPLVIVPPQINKFYVLDLAPGRSLVEAALEQGQQAFMVSWRNPGPDQRDWNLDTYVSALMAALDAAREITSQPQVNLMAACAGGITSAAMLGYLAAVDDERVRSVTFLVTALDWNVPSTVSTFASGRALAAAKRRSRTKGVLEGRELANMFAWLRPNDLVWNYWVNNYLMGKNPPAFDILAWNGDATNLPAGLHADFMEMSATNALAEPGQLEVLGTKVDLGRVTSDAYIVAGLTDHIIPWQACYQSPSLLGGKSEFVLCNSGHIQTLVCPTDNAKASYLTNADRPESAEDWKAGADRHQGSWWTHWLEWLSSRSGDLVEAPSGVGSEAHPAGAAAPGSYVHG